MRRLVRETTWRGCRALVAAALLSFAALPAADASQPPIEDHYYGATLFVARTANAVAPPVAVGSLAAYQAVYGTLPDPASDHGLHAARLFFANGGRTLFVADPGGSTAQHFRNALAASAALPVDVVALPGLAASGIGVAERALIASALLAHVDASPNRFGLVDAPQGSSVGALVDFAGAFSSAHAAVYAPWLDVADTAGGFAAMPASAAVAGIISRVDHERGIFRSPTGPDFPLSTSFEVRLQQAFSSHDSDQLSQARVNPLRSFTGMGILVWGARTLGTDPERRYVSVSRFLRLLDFSIRRSLAWIPLAAEPPSTVALRALIEDYLHAYWQRGAMPGITPAQAYFVRCREDPHALHCDVGVAPLRPQEFTLLSFDFSLDDRIFAAGFEVAAP